MQEQRRSSRTNAGQPPFRYSDSYILPRTESKNFVTLCREDGDKVQFLTWNINYSVVQFPLLPCIVCNGKVLYNTFHQYLKCEDCFGETEHFVHLKKDPVKGNCLFSRQAIVQGQIIGMPAGIDPHSMTDEWLKQYNENNETHYCPFFNPQNRVPQETMDQINERYGPNASPKYLIYARQRVGNRYSGFYLDGIRCLTFPSLANSDANPNCEIVYNGKEGDESKAMLIATRDIPEDEEITWDYSYDNSEFSISVIPSASTLEKIKNENEIKKLVMDELNEKDLEMENLRQKVQDLKLPVKSLFYPSGDEEFFWYDVLLNFLEVTKESIKSFIETKKTLDELQNKIVEEDKVLLHIKEQMNPSMNFLTAPKLTQEAECERKKLNVQKHNFWHAVNIGAKENEDMLHKIMQTTRSDYVKYAISTNGETIERKEFDKFFFTCIRCTTIKCIGELAFQHNKCGVMKCHDCVSENAITDCLCLNANSTPHRYTINLGACSICNSHVSVIKPQMTNENVTNHYAFQLKACNCDISTAELL